MKGHETVGNPLALVEEEVGQIKTYNFKIQFLNSPFISDYLNLFMLLTEFEVARRLYRGLDEHIFDDLPARVTHPYDLLPVGVAIALATEGIVVIEGRTFNDSDIWNAFDEDPNFEKAMQGRRSDSAFERRAAKRRRTIMDIIHKSPFHISDFQQVGTPSMFLRTGFFLALMYVLFELCETSEG